MRWSIGLVGERLFTGGRLGNGGRLRFGNRLISKSVADDSCANSTGRFYVLREVCRPPEGASLKGWTIGSAGSRSNEGSWSSNFSTIALLVGGRRCRAFDERNLRAVKGLQPEVTEVLTPREINLQIFVNTAIYKKLQPDILVLSRRTTVPETKQGLRQA